MCGRFVRHSSLKLIEKTFNVDAGAFKGAQPGYNIAPTQDVWAVYQKGDRILDSFRWGLVPFWAKDASIGSRMINARAETVDSKPSFRNAFKKRRCLIIADGFYEWKGPKGRKQPWYITPRSGGPIAFAGIWGTWHRKDDAADEPLQPCAIITTAASPAIADIHDRMPVILNPRAYQPWLQTDETAPERLKRILRNEIVSEFDRHPVTPRINNVRYDAADGIEPLGDLTA